MLCGKYSKSKHIKSLKIHTRSYSKLTPIILPIKCCILHNVLDNVLFRNLSSIIVNWFVFHSVPVKHQFWCLLNSELQILLNLIWRNVTSQEQDVLIVFKLISQVIKKVNKILTDFLLSLVKEQNDILVCGHSLLEILSRQLLLLCWLLGLLVHWPLVFFYLLDKVCEGLFGVRSSSHESSLRLSVHGYYTLLVGNCESSYGIFVFRIVRTKLHEHNVVVSFGQCSQSFGVFSVFGRVDMNDRKLFYEWKRKLLLMKIFTHGSYPRVNTLANTFLMAVSISSTDAFTSVICLLPITNL